MKTWLVFFSKGRFLPVLIARFGCALFFLLSFSIIEPSTTRAEEKFLSPTNLRLIEQANSVKAYPLASMRMLPQVLSYEEREERFAKTLSEGQKKFLVQFLQKSYRIDPAPRLHSCQYLPGVEFVFSMQDSKAKDASKSLSLLLCFNCKVWGINPADQKKYDFEEFIPVPQQPTTYGDSEKEDGELRSLVKEIFGDKYFENN